MHTTTTTASHQALSVMCDAFLPAIQQKQDPSDYWRRTPSSLQVANHILDLIAKLPEGEQKEFKLLLQLLNSPLLGLSWGGPLKKAIDLEASQREALLQTWAKSSIPLLRKSYQSLKKLCGFIYFGYSDSDTPNPNWEALGYPGPLLPTPQLNNSLSPLLITETHTLSGDTVIIGSGAGGAVVAAELAAEGQEVIVVEKGPYLKEDQLTQRESEMISTLYERNGALSTKDGAMTIFAGSCLGGGTTINWSASFRTPDYILEEWAVEHQNPHFISPYYQQCFDAIEQRTLIHSLPCIHNRQNQALADGAKALGYHYDIIPRNTLPHAGGGESDIWKNYSYSCLGDRQGQKQGALKTFLSDAAAAGATFLTDTEVSEIQIQHGEVKGVKAWHTDERGQRLALTIKAKRVIVSAGSLHTPALLMRSGLQHSQIGHNLYLHPVVPVSAVYPTPVSPWYGPMMSAVSDEFIQLDGNFGYKLETPPVHPGLAALVTPWLSGQQYKQDMLALSHLGSFIVLTRDKYGGQITLDKQGKMQVKYRLHNYDKVHLLHGLKEAIRIHEAAGADSIRLLHNEMEVWQRQKSTSLERFIAKVDQKTWTPNRFLLFSAHQMGTCRMGGDNHKHPIQPNGESREVKNLFVADASALPRCSGVNPMLSIQALAHYIAQGIK